MGFIRFLSYNNAVPIVITLLLVGAGATFAATEPEALLSKTETIIAVDNTYLVSKDLNSYRPNIVIQSVTEDETSYFVTYLLTTIDVVDGVWRDVEKSRLLTVDKNVLGATLDLGLFTTEQLKQVVDRELERLRGTQEIERKIVSPKIIAVEYGGLVGKFLDTTTEELPGYVPVVAPPPPPTVIGEVAGASTVNTTAIQPDVGDPGQDTTPPNIQLLGPNPAHVALGGSYTDLGVVVTDDRGGYNLKLFLNGGEVTSIQLETKEPGLSLIRYEATDGAGNIAMIERSVVVGASQELPATPAETAPATPQPAAATTTEESALSTPEAPENEPAPSEEVLAPEPAEAPPSESVQPPPAEPPVTSE